MPGITEALLDIGQAVAKDLAMFGTQHVKHAIGYPGRPAPGQKPAETAAPPQFTPFQPRPMPTLTAPPFLAQSAAPVATISASGAIAPVTPAQPIMAAESLETQASVAESYAAEWEDLSIACAPCTTRHLGTMTEQLEEALEAKSEHEKREHLATFAAEGWSWLDFDTTAEKLARTPSMRDRMAVAKASAAMRPVIEGFPSAPRSLDRAWGAINEAKRFARSAKRTERDDVQVEVRMERVIGWVGSLDTQYSSDPRMQEHLKAIRDARHNWTREGYTGAALTQAETALCAAAIDMTPIPDDATIREAHRATKAAMRAFFRDVAVAQGRNPEAQMRPPVTAKAGAMLRPDVDTAIPGELRGALLTSPQAAQEPLNRLLGATDATDAAYRGILKMQALRGVPVREENLPPVIEKGQIVGTIQGAYLPSGGNVWLSPAVVSESPNGLFTLAHESVHSLLHSPACDIYPDTDDYANDPHEAEANCATVLALLDTGLPFEDDEGHRIDSRQVRLDLSALERRLGANGMRRVAWAASVLTRAIKGDSEGAARESGACPR